MNRPDIAALKEDLRNAPSITMFQNTSGEVMLGLGTARSLTTAEEIEAVANAMIERLPCPDAPPENPAIK